MYGERQFEDLKPETPGKTLIMNLFEETDLYSDLAFRDRAILLLAQHISKLEDRIDELSRS